MNLFSYFKPSFLIKILKNWRNIFFLRDVFIYKITPLLYKKNNGFYLLKEKWDNLIILDACRYDIFKEVLEEFELPGKLEKKISRGTHTYEFLCENFKKFNLNNIIYITANPYVNKYFSDCFYKIVSVWKDNWDDKYHTVLPESMYEQTLDVLVRYSNKKLIIHFMQPHYPYIGYKITEDSLKTLKKSRKKEFRKNFFHIYSGKIYRLIDKKEHLKIYKENLINVLRIVKKLINELPGITVITSDHGEAFGEKIFPLMPFRYYGHHDKLRIRSLIEVPWFVIELKDKNLSMDYKKERKLILNSIEELKSKGFL